MGLKVYESNQVEKLIKPLLVSLNNQSGDLFDSSNFVISGFGIEQWLLKNIAQQQKVFFNGQFFFAQRWLNQLAEGLALSSDVLYQKPALVFRIFKILSSNYLKSNKIGEFLNIYIDSKSSVIIDKKLLNLCYTLAGLFDNYQWQREEWLTLWKNNDNIDLPNHLGVTQHFQAELWRCLLNDETPKNQYSTRHGLIKKIISKLNKGSSAKLTSQLSWLNGNVRFFCLNPIMSPVWHVMCALSEHLDIEVYWLNPSQELWCENLYLPLVESKKSLSAFKGIDSSHLFYQHHPLLMSLGQSGASVLQQIINFNSCETKSYFNEQVEDVNPKAELTLLNRVQESILLDTADYSTWTMNALDQSVQIYSCESKIDELKCLFHQIQHWLTNQKECDVSDVLIVSPTIENYSAWIPIIFKEIPHFVQKVPVEKKSLHSAFSFLIGLPNEDLQYNHLAELFQFSSVKKNLDFDDEFLYKSLNHIYDLGFRWGINDSEKQEVGFASGSSFQSINEWLCKDLLSQSFFALNDWVNVVKLQKYFENLSLFFQQSQEKNSIQKWITIFKNIVNTLLENEESKENEENEAESLVILNALKQLEHRAELTQFNDSVSYAFVYEALFNELSKSKTQTNYLSGKLVFADAITMRCVPAKFIAVLGMNDEVSPVDGNSLLDLSWGNARLGDRSIEGESNYQLLESLLSARNVLYMSYINADETTAGGNKNINIISDYLVKNNVNYNDFHQRYQTINSVEMDFNTQRKYDEHTKKGLDLIKNDDKPPLTTHDLARELINPVKTYLKYQGVFINPKVAQHPKTHQEEKLNSLLNADFVKGVIIDVLVNDIEKIELGIVKESQNPKWINSLSIEEALNNKYKDLQDQIVNLNLNDTIDKNKFSIGKSIEKVRLTNHVLSAQSDILSNEELVFVSGGKLNLQKLLTTWLSHLVGNCSSGKVTHYIFNDGVSSKRLLKVVSFQAVPSEDAVKVLDAYLSLNQSIKENLIWAIPGLVLDIALEKELIQESLKKEYLNSEDIVYRTLINNDKVFDLSEQSKTMVDSKSYAEVLWQNSICNSVSSGLQSIT